MIKSIENLILVNDVSNVKVSENGEKLVLLNDVRPDSLVVFSKAFKEHKKGSIENVLVRETVKERLIAASEQLPKGYKLVVWETYTPKALQESIRNTKLDDISGLSHMTGGAVDVSLADENGNLLDMGTDLNHGSPENKSTTYFEELDELNEKEKELRENRRILFHAMSEAGFVNNPLAWFHWDYGNLWWAKVKGEDAFYGSLDV
jgi:D-alanyl-D-alanine dipeptidase